MAVKIKIRLDTLLEYLIVMFALLDGNMMWKLVENSICRTQGVSPYIAKYIFMVLIVIYVLAKGVKKKEIIIAGMILLYNLAFMAINSTDAVLFIQNFALPIALMVMFSYKLRRCKRLANFLKAFSNIVFVLAFISLVLYLLGPVLGVLPGKSVFVIRNDYYSYYVQSYFNLMYTGQTQKMFGVELLRNTGLYLEAPGWVYPLCLALFCEMFLGKHIKKWRVVVLLLTILTTFSSKGFIITPLILILKVYEGKRNKYTGKSIIQLFKMFLLPIALLVGIFAFGILMETKSVYEVESYYSRIADTIAALNVWKQNFLFGCGYNNLAAFNRVLTGNYLSSITCGMFKVLAQCGLFIGIEYYGGYFACIKKARFCPKKTVVFFVLIQMIFLFVSSSYDNLFFLFFISYGWSGIMGRHKLHRNKLRKGSLHE